MRRLIALTSLAILLMISAASAAVTCEVVPMATAILGVTEDISVTCSGISDSISITPSVGSEAFLGSCIEVTPSSLSVSASSPTGTFSAEGTKVGCSGNGKIVTWQFSGTSAPNSETTNYNIIFPPTMTPTFMNSTYSVNNGTATNLSVTLQLSTVQNAVDIRGIEIILITNLNGSVAGVSNMTGITIDVSESTTKSVTWNLELPPMPPGMDYDFNVSISADNADPASARTTIEIVNGTGNVSSVQVSIGLNAGWNLISVPAQADNMSSSALLASIPGFNRAWMYNASDGSPWKLYNPGGFPFLNTLREVSPDYGYWVSVSGAGSLNVTGSIVTSLDADLVAGWNLMGYPFTVPRTVSSAFSGLSNFDRAWAYNSSSGTPWNLYDPDGMGMLNTLAGLNPTFGYWVRVTSSETWSLS
ncbi:MAG: hypothetical protein ABH879_02860 [archaeon]